MRAVGIKLHVVPFDLQVLEQFRQVCVLSGLAAGYGDGVDLTPALLEVLPELGFR